jgi:hypothetical protein
VAAVNMGVVTAGLTTMGVAWVGLVGMGPIRIDPTNWSIAQHKIPRAVASVHFVKVRTSRPARPVPLRAAAPSRGIGARDGPGPTARWFPPDGCMGQDLS